MCARGSEEEETGKQDRRVRQRRGKRAVRSEALTGGPAGRVRVGVASLAATERWARRGNRASVALKESWAAEGCWGRREVWAGHGNRPGTGLPCGRRQAREERKRAEQKGAGLGRRKRKRSWAGQG